MATLSILPSGLSSDKVSRFSHLNALSPGVPVGVRAPRKTCSRAFRRVRSFQQRHVRTRHVCSNALGNGDAGPDPVHEVTLSDAPSTRNFQEAFLEFFRQSPGQNAEDSGGLSADRGVLPRSIVLRSDTAAEGVGEAGLKEEFWPVEWTVLGALKSRKLAIGSIPTSAEQVEAVLSQGGFDAVVVVMHPAEILALDIDIKEIGESVSQSNKVFLQCPVTDGKSGGYRDETGLGVVDVLKLKEALRAVTALVKTGQRTLVCCPRGTTISALVALCLLTFVEGLSLLEALAALRFSVPGASPPLRSWDEARDSWSTLEDSTRLRKLADEASRGRMAANKPGSAMDDWVAARQQLIIEMLTEQANADVALAKIVSRAGEDNPSAPTTGQPPSSGAVLAGYQEYLQQSMADVAAAAEQETALLRSALEQSSAESKKLAAELAAAERQLADATMARRRAERAEEEQPSAFSEIEAFLAQSALESALRQEQDAKENIQSLEVELRSSSRQQAAAVERLDFLEREAARLRQKEEASRQVAKQAVKQSRQLASMLERAEVSRAAAAGKAEVLAAEVEALREQNLKAEKTEAELIHLREEAASLSCALKAAQDAAAAAKDRSEFLMRQVAALKEKVETGKQGDVLVQVVKTANHGSDELIARLQAELLETRERARKAEEERDVALQQVSVLTVKLEEAEKKVQEATKKLLQAEDRIGFLLRQVDATRLKRNAAEGALAAAKQQVHRMGRNVETMRQRLFQSTSESNKSAVAAEALISTAESLYSKLEEHAKKLQASIIATDQATANLEHRQKSGTSVKTSVSPLADSIPQILARAREKAESGAAMSTEEVTLLQEATCLREAVEFLDAAKSGVAQQGNGALPASAVGLFNDIVQKEREKDMMRVSRSADPRS